MDESEKALMLNQVVKLRDDILHQKSFYRVLEQNHNFQTEMIRVTQTPLGLWSSYEKSCENLVQKKKQMEEWEAVLVEKEVALQAEVGVAVFEIAVSLHTEGTPPVEALEMARRVMVPKGETL